MQVQESAAAAHVQELQAQGQQQLQAARKEAAESAAESARVRIPSHTHA